MKLLVIFHVHEVITVAILIEELHGDFVHRDLFNGITGAETMLEHRPGADIAQLGLNECPQIAGRAVFHGKDQVQVIIVLNDHAWTHLCCWNCHESGPFSPEIAVTWQELPCSSEGNGEQMPVPVGPDKVRSQT